jgi:hypothetical protein
VICEDGLRKAVGGFCRVEGDSGPGEGLAGVYGNTAAVVLWPWRLERASHTKADVEVTVGDCSISTGRKKELANRPLIREQAFGESLDPDKLERLGRYEVHLDRKLERTLAMLLRLKDLRQGAIAG